MDDWLNIAVIPGRCHGPVNEANRGDIVWLSHAPIALIFGPSSLKKIFLNKK